jgi:hypothetical protein
VLGHAPRFVPIECRRSTLFGTGATWSHFLPYTEPLPDSGRLNGVLGDRRYVQNREIGDRSSQMPTGLTGTIQPVSRVAVLTAPRLATVAGLRQGSPISLLCWAGDIDW